MGIAMVTGSLPTARWTLSRQHKVGDHRGHCAHLLTLIALCDVPDSRIILATALMAAIVLYLRRHMHDSSRWAQALCTHYRGGG